MSRTLILTGGIIVASLAGACAHPGPSPSRAGGAATPPAVPAALAVPAGAELVAHFHALGAQLYVCAVVPGAAPPSYAWTLQRPEASLYGEDGAVAGTHGAGPTWTSADGSSVVGKKVAQSDAPDAAAIPWLLVRAVSTSGHGVFSNVTYIQRLTTASGKAPSSGCAAATVDAEAQTAYSADYYFYRGGAQ